MKKNVITGIGNALAKILSQEGYALGLAGRRANLLDSLAKELTNKTSTAEIPVIKISLMSNMCDA